MNLEEYRRRIENAHTVTGFPTYWEDLQKMTEERDEWESLVRSIVDAVMNEGPSPEFHRKIMRRHRSEWPFLWDKIDKAILSCKENPPQHGRRNKENFS
jgi:hypothetical protein